MLNKRLILIIYFTASLFSGFAQRIMKAHDSQSKIHFVIKNFGIKTGGNFSGLQGTIQFNPENLSSAIFDVTVKAGSVDTDNSTRDNHLKKDDYFDVEKYPLIRMQSEQIIRTKVSNQYTFKGRLTIKGMTKPVSFTFSATPEEEGYLFVSDMFELNRRDFNVGGNSISLSDVLKLNITVFAK